MSEEKSKEPVEFGAKLDLSVENALGRIEKISFEAYNESKVLIPAIENYYKCNGHYPERVLADKIYRNRINLDYCKDRGIRLAGPALGRPGKVSLFFLDEISKDNETAIILTVVS